MATPFAFHITHAGIEVGGTGAAAANLYAHVDLLWRERIARLLRVQLQIVTCGVLPAP